jgi:hypothetical protein
MAMASARYADLLRAGAITSTLSPTCGYFVFAKILAPLPDDYVRVDGHYFNQRGYPQYVKLNLLSPALSLIDGTTSPGILHGQ